MELELTRSIFTEKSTIGGLSVDGQFECFILEDKDRGLVDSMKLAEIQKIKIPHVTAIPAGRYKVIVTKSVRFSKEAGHDVYLPLLVNVPGYDGVRIHPGNKPEHTEGCLLPGTDHSPDTVMNSRTAWVKLNDKINLALKTEEVWITIKPKYL
jgi:hypothetical protein